MSMEQDRPANPALIVAFISSVFGFLSFASIFDLSADSVFAIGLIRLVLGLLYFIGAMINLLKGFGGGNLNLIFSVCFGLFSGSNILVGFMDSPIAVNDLPPFYAMLQLMAGLFLACILPVMKRLPLYQWICFLMAVLGLIFFGLSDLLSHPFCKIAGGIFFLAFGCLNIYTGLSSILPELPQGPVMQKALLRQQPEEVQAPRRHI